MQTGKDAPAAAATTATTPIIRFAAFGDYGTDDMAEQAVANLVDSLNVDFIITTGDNSYGSGSIDTNVGRYYHEYIGNYSGAYLPGSATNRFFPSMGNHDWSDGGQSAAYLDYFTLPGTDVTTTNTAGNERYYDFIQGPVHFFAIDSDSNEPDGNTSTAAQAVWLQTQLAAATAPWKIVYFHHPPYSSGYHGNSLAMQWPFKAWGATAVLGGHDHTYERLIVDGFPYFVTGLGGRNIYAFSTPEPGSQARYNAGNGTMLVEASDTSIVFEFWSIADGGTLIDTYGLTRDLPVPTLTTMATLPPTATVVPTETPLPIATVAIATASTPPAVAPPAATATLLAPAPAPATARSPAGRSIWVGVALIGALTGALVLLAAGVLLVRRH